MHSQQRKDEGGTAQIVGWTMPARENLQRPSPSPVATGTAGAGAAAAVTQALRIGPLSAGPLTVGPLSHDAAARLVLAEVGRAFAVDEVQLLSNGRCTAPIALARQVAMYLLHVELGRQLSEVGRLLKRDRTTVSHACAHVEDLREDSGFDGRIDEIELAIRRGRLTADRQMGAAHVERA